jgi:hypothetical protein
VFEPSLTHGKLAAIIEFPREGTKPFHL